MVIDIDVNEIFPFSSSSIAGRQPFNGCYVEASYPFRRRKHDRVIDNLSRLKERVGMRNRLSPMVGFVLLSVLILTSASWLGATPLALKDNIEAVKANQPEPDKAFTFVVLGDSRDGAEVFGRLLNRAMTFEPLFILHTGDLVTEGRPSEYEDYAKRIAAFPIPILHVPGNHDARRGPDTYRNYVGDLNWYFDLGAYRIVGLDNAKGEFTRDAYAFARKNLTTRKVCFVAFHRPPAIGSWKAHAMKGDSAEIMDLIKEAKVPMVFLGHIHLYDEMNINGTKYVIAAGGGAPLHGKYNFGKAEYGFLVVRVAPKGITHQWVRLE